MRWADDLFQQLEHSRRARAWFIAVPILFVLFSAVMLGLPQTRVAARPILLYENGPVELLTFAFFLWGGLASLALAVRSGRMGLGALTAGFYVAFGLGLVWIAGEEIAWGQWFFHWVTPASWKAVNVQGETTLHNVAALNDYLPLLHVVFAAGALVGIAVARVKPLRYLATPPVLWSWFAFILVHNIFEQVLELAMRNSVPHKFFERTSEVVEMYLGMAAWAYVYLNTQRIRRLAGDCAPEAAAAEGAPAIDRS